MALAVAWAAYLIPKALRHHDDVVRGRSVDRFSQQHARARASRAGQCADGPARRPDPRHAAVEAERRSPSPRRARPRPTEQYAARRLAAARPPPSADAASCPSCCSRWSPSSPPAPPAASSWPYVAIPAALLVAWLVACRLMVKKERAWRPGRAVRGRRRASSRPTRPRPPCRSSRSPRRRGADRPTRPCGTRCRSPCRPTSPSRPARRTVRTIDLDSTGVWTSGRTEADSALAREAEAADRVRRRTSRKGEPGEEAVGS